MNRFHAAFADELVKISSPWGSDGEFLASRAAHKLTGASEAQLMAMEFQHYHGAKMDQLAEKVRQYGPAALTAGAGLALANALMKRRPRMAR